MKDIIRFKKNGKTKLIHFLVTEEQAREWCNSEHTQKEGKYFDGFATTGTYCTRQKPYYDHYFTPTEDFN